MAHYAFLDENNIVTHVIPGKEEGTDGIDWEAFYAAEVGQKCKRTSYNTRNGYHKNENQEPFRKNFAGVGYIYDEEADAFYPPQPNPSWTLNLTTYLWEPPVSVPADAGDIYYEWDEENQKWIRPWFDWDEVEEKWIPKNIPGFTWDEIKNIFVKNN
jgi:hypothetical protein